MNEDRYTLSAGWLDVGNGHKIYYQDWGNPKAKTPIFFLHGGPGAGSKDRYKLPFDPMRQRVIFHDQRGCGKSTPFGSIKQNTTEHLINDISKLKKRLGINKISLVGGSWGSALCLCYAIENPAQVEKMLLWGTYLARQQDNDFIYYEVGKHFPDVSQRFMSIVPKSKRSDIVNYYWSKFEDSDRWVQLKYAREWNLYEYSLMNLDAQTDLYRQETDSSEDEGEDEEKELAGAMLEAHYIKNNAFIPENYILKSASKIKNIPIILVHGRHDFVCPPDGAFALAQKLPNNVHLHVVMGGHARESTLREVVKAYARSFLG